MMVRDHLLRKITILKEKVWIFLFWHWRILYIYATFSGKWFGWWILAGVRVLDGANIEGNREWCIGHIMIKWRFKLNWSNENGDDNFQLMGKISW